MKKILCVVAVCAALGSCKSKTDSTEGSNNLVPLDSSHAYKNNTATDIPQNLRPVSKVKDTAVTTTVVTVTKTPVAPKEHPVNPKPAPVVSNPKTVTSTTNTTTTTSPSTNTSTTTTTAPVATAPEPPKKKGLSDGAKGAIIGAGAGGVTGGIIGKNVKGAIIGSAIGAAGGYIIGRAKDKKDGRVKKDSL